ncbi:MAG: LamG domain-containing protein [Pseudomonadota bacterium]
MTSFISARSITAARKKLSLRLQLGVAGTVLSAIIMVAGCSSSDSNSNPGGLTSGSAGQAGTAALAGGSALGGSGATGGNGGAVTAGFAGSVGGTAGNTSSGGSAAAGSGGSAAGSGGSAGGGAVMCPAGGEAGDSGLEPTGDEDSDGVPNCLDGCPSDAAKTAPGSCGCGRFDDDTDQDGTPDCKDECPNDSLKTAPGVCGCEHSDTANADNDAAVDCKDACPKDAALTEAGTCGCLPASLGALCLAHRYQFDGSGTVATDSIAGANGAGTIVGAQLSGTGSVVLLGASSEQYVSLPRNLISALGDSATFEAWVTWPGTGGDWQRIFDFGVSDAGAGQIGKAAGSVFLTPRASGSGFRGAITPSDFSEETVAGIDTALPTSVLTHVALVVDGAGGKLSLYRDGVVQGTGASIPPWVRLGLLNDANNWLGRSQYQGDEGFAGTLHEFRIYSRALTANEINASFTAGADMLPP